jgi:mannosyltransferase
MGAEIAAQSRSEPMTTGEPSPARRRYWNALAWTGVVVGAGLRFFQIGSKSLWFDEGYTAWMTNHPAKEIVRLIRADTAPPLFYVLLHGWTLVFGRSEAALRSMSAVFSAITLLFVLGIARRMLKGPAAVAAVIWLLVLGFHQQFYAQEARVYALMALLAVLTLDFVQRHLASNHRGWLIPICITLAASLYAHNIMALYVVATVPLWLLLPSHHSIARRLRDGSLVACGVVALYLPWLVTSLRSQVQMVGNHFWAEKLSLIPVFTITGWIAGIPRREDWNYVIYRYLRTSHALGDLPALFGPVLIVGVAVLAIAYQSGRGRRNAMALGSYLLLPPIAVAVYSVFRTPILIDKIFLPSATLMPVFLMMPLAMELSPRARKGVQIGVGVLLLVSVCTLVDYLINPQKEDWRSAAAAVREMPDARRLIVFVAEDGQLPFDFYYRYRPGEEPKGAPAGFFDVDPPRTMLQVTRPSDCHALERKIVAGNYDEVVLVLCHAPWGDANGYVRVMLDRHYPREVQKDLFLITICRYQP